MPTHKFILDLKAQVQQGHYPKEIKGILPEKIRNDLFLAQLCI